MNHGTERNRERWEKLTPEQQAAVLRIRAQNATPEARAEEERLIETAKLEFPPKTAEPELVEFLAGMRLLRERMGLSLGDISKRTGIDAATLSKLETGKVANPTMGTLTTYAGAMGKRLVLAVED